jgi:hypothetical protein
MPQRDPYASPIDYEILEEKAATLARVTARFEATLAALEALEGEIAAVKSPSAEILAQRANLIGEAAQWLWYVVIQREAVGVTSHDALFEAYCIPPAVRRCMGPKRQSRTNARTP